MDLGPLKWNIIAFLVSKCSHKCSDLIGEEEGYQWIPSLGLKELTLETTILAGEESCFLSP